MKTNTQHIILPTLAMPRANARGHGLVRDETRRAAHPELSGRPSLIKASEKSRNTLRYNTERNLSNNHGSTFEGAINRSMLNPYGNDQPLLASMANGPMIEKKALHLRKQFLK